jgi:hypothetical protein
MIKPVAIFFIKNSSGELDFFLILSDDFIRRREAIFRLGMEKWGLLVGISRTLPVQGTISFMGDPSPFWAPFRAKADI